MKFVIRIECLVNGQSTDYDGSFVKRFDFEGCGAGECHLDTVRDPQRALLFDDQFAAWSKWQTVDERAPARADGLPNRPMTAFSVSILSVEQAQEEA